MSASPSLLLLRFGAIGDCVMAAWAATAYRDRFPAGRLVWALEPRIVPVVEQGRLVNSVAEFDRDAWKASRWSPATWRRQLVAYTRLRRPRFDWGLDLHGHSKTALALRLAAPRRRLAARASDAFAARLNPLLPPDPTPLHAVERNHRALCAFGEFALPERPIMPSGESFKPGSIAIATGAGSPEKAWPPERWAEVARALLAGGTEVVFLGGPGDPRPEAPGALDRVGRAPLAETRDRVASSAMVVAADTGAGHLAAAYGVPAVSLFGPSDPGEFRPFGRRVRVLRHGPRVEAIEVADVLKAVDELRAEATCGS